MSCCVRSGASRSFMDADSWFCKAFSCIPLLGNIPHILNERALKREIESAARGLDSARVIQLIGVKNHYKTPCVSFSFGKTHT